MAKKKELEFTNMKKTISLIFILLIFTLLIACAPQTPASSPTPSPTPPSTSTPASSSAEYRKITAEAAKARMDSGDAIIVVDVRTEEEYNSGHIEGAILIPNESIATDQPEFLPDLDAEILIYCRSGNRSKQAADKLIQMGYTNIFDFGGIIDWPYDTVTTNTK